MIDGLLRQAGLSRQNLQLEELDLSALCHEIDANLRTVDERRELELVIQLQTMVRPTRRCWACAEQPAEQRFTATQARAGIEVGTLTL
ncbi:hypothetical protein [Cupriavidus sp. PET2-C1]